MATALVPLQRLSRLQPKYFLFAIVGAMVAYVFQHNERFLIDPADPAWNHYQPFKWWLLPHGLSGACALLLGPMQFFGWLRRRFAILHRVIGRIYVSGVFLAAPLGVYIQYFEERMGAPRSFTIAAVVDAILLMSTTAVAFLFIRKGMVEQHRQWMTRSYSVALVFLEVRVISGVFGLDGKGIAVAELIVWICLAFSIPFADAVLQIQQSWRYRSTTVKTNVT